MIVTASIPAADSSDAESVRTLVPVQRVPPWVPTLTICSHITSTVALAYAIQDSVNLSYQYLPNAFVPTVLAYTLSLPFHIAILLLKWLERHKTESIMSFTPATPRYIAYSVLLVAFWVASVAVCSINLHTASKPNWFFCSDDNPACIQLKMTIDNPPVKAYATPLASELASSVTLVLSIAITTRLFMYHRQLLKKSRSAAGHDGSMALEPKGYT
ncbi:hypothetical protein JR316_0012888 [Psilocybe cubensis]|uniref:Uncharacterized protein n=2 Tax=Psilocybe cubensis TaxID=181762 RepID=A0ACB8GFN9_PSICU|nr:hypothetical protein JR316_0012888 [Psilocybe cubensis]KAH9474429.1 hypothetical protein JR316_0012888 [Psilocybe cubensis]